MDGSRLNVISRCFKNLFMPSSKPHGWCAVASTAGSPEYTTTLSARYVAMIKSCSTMNAVFLLWMMNRLITFDAQILCSESRYADGSSMRYRSAG